MKGEEIYFVITPSPDGMYIQVYSKGQLADALGDDESGVDPDRIFEGMPGSIDMNEWSEGHLIIKGRVVTPRPISVVKEWRIE